MFIQWLRKEKRTAQLYTLIAFVVMSLVFLVVTYLLQVNEDANIRSRVEIIERDLVELEKTTMEDKLNRRAADILFVTDMLKLSDTMLGDYSRIEEPWIAFSNRYKIFDQIRYLDNTGQEQIRINYSPLGAYAVDESELQDKSARTYFLNGRLMSNGKIYISEMDLNVENEKVEIPFRPMLRLSTPLHQGNWRDGVVVLNYNADDMLQDVRDIAEDRETEISCSTRMGIGCTTISSLKKNGASCLKAAWTKALQTSIRRHGISSPAAEGMDRSQRKPERSSIHRYRRRKRFWQKTTMCWCSAMRGFSISYRLFRRHPPMASTFRKRCCKPSAVF